jgi:Mg2+ and Co2+ transporter CorA
MTEIVVAVQSLERDRIAGLLEAGDFFWVDVALSATSPDELGEVLGVPERSLQALLGFGADRPSSRRFHADGQRVVFAVSAYLDSTAPAHESPECLLPVEVHVLVSGAYLLTLHEERASLPDVLAPYTPEGRREQYVIYAVLDAIVASAFDALYELELTLDDLAVMTTDLRAGRVRMASLRSISSRLSRMRRQVGVQRGLLERIGVEIERVEGLEADDSHYFDRSSLVAGVALIGALVARGSPVEPEAEMPDAAHRSR